MGTCTQKRTHRTHFTRLGLTLAMLFGLLASFSPVSADNLPFDVTNTSDNGAGSLRQAIAQAGDGDTIFFAPSLSGQTIHVGSPLSISEDITIDGCPLQNLVTISGSESVGVIQITGEGSVTLQCLLITGGYAGTGTNGGGIANAGELILNNITISGSTTAGNGGGIYNSGSLTLNYSALSGNSAEMSGGGIYNSGTLILNDSTIHDNAATYFGAGIFNQGAMSVTYSRIAANAADSIAGGIYNHTLGTLSIASSAITGNSAPWAGGISNDGTLMVAASTFAGNSTTGNGGAIANDGLGTITTSTFTANSANWGGGISNNGTITVTNSTFSGNSAGGKDAGGKDAGGGDGGGIYHAIGTMSLTNTILANSTTGLDCYASKPIDTHSHNLIETSSNCGTPLLSADPGLNVLANNGGSTQTMALLPGSPALDAASEAGCSDTDQRGVIRPQGAGCDIGAFEQQAPSVVTGAASAIASRSAMLNGTVNAHNFTSTAIFEYGLTSAYGGSAAVVPGPVSGAAHVPVRFLLSGLEPNTTYHYRVVAANSIGENAGADQTFTTWHTVNLPLIRRK